jgi:hypothetical protein
VGVQGDVTTSTGATFPFDYEGKPYNYHEVRGYGSYGYRPGYNYDPAAEKPRNCKFIVDVCSCGAACEIVPGGKMGIQMKILTNGVYWAEPDYISDLEIDEYNDATDEADPVKTRSGHPTVYFDMFSGAEIGVSTADHDPSEGVLCRRINPLNYMEEPPYYYDATDRTRTEGSEGETAFGNSVRNFGVVKYYTKMEFEGDYLTPSQHCKFRSNPVNQYKDANGDSLEWPLAGEHKDAIPARNRVNILQSVEATDYVFTINDTGSAAGNCKIWIDIPEMRIDPTIAKQGEIVKIQVRLLFNRMPSGICPDCDPPDVCDVTVDTGIVCPSKDTPTTSDYYCMFFPYVLQGIQNTQGWSTGIAISARDVMPADAEIQLILRDKAGNIAKYKRTDMGSGLVWSFVLDDQMDKFDGSLVPGATSLQVISNYSMDGYQFLNVVGQFGAGSNARGCGSGQCCPTGWNAGFLP